MEAERAALAGPAAASIASPATTATSHFTVMEQATIKFLDTIYPRLSAVSKQGAALDVLHIAQAFVDCQKETPYYRIPASDDHPGSAFAEDQPYGIIKLIGLTYTLDRCLFDKITIDGRRTYRFEMALAFLLDTLRYEGPAYVEWWDRAMRHVRRGQPARVTEYRDLEGLVKMDNSKAYKCGIYSRDYQSLEEHRVYVGQTWSQSGAVRNAQHRYDVQNRSKYKLEQAESLYNAVFLFLIPKTLLQDGTTVFVPRSITYFAESTSIVIHRATVPSGASTVKVWISRVVHTS